MFVFIVTDGSGHAIPRARRWAGPSKGSARRGEKPPAGVEPDECPHGLGNAQPSARPPGRGGQNGQRIAQQVAGAGECVERICVEPDQLLGPALPEPVESTGVAGATQPAADGGR